MEKALAIVGAGRVGQSLGRSLHENGWKIQSVVTRSEPRARKAVRFIGAGKPSAAITRSISSAPAILICVPDDAIRETAMEEAGVEMAMASGMKRREAVRALLSLT
jgi:prephenate dehydrogenase